MATSTRNQQRTEDWGACPACGGRIPAHSSTARVVAVGPIGSGDNRVRACDDGCAHRFFDGETRKRQCAGCGATFTGTPGKVAHYCCRQCETSAARRRAQVWRDAATNALPGDLAALRQAATDVAWLEGEVEAGRVVAPRIASDLLRARARELSDVSAAVGQFASATAIGESITYIPDGHGALKAVAARPGVRQDLTAFLKAQGAA